MSENKQTVDNDILLEEQQVNVDSYSKTQNKFSTYLYA